MPSSPPPRAPGLAGRLTLLLALGLGGCAGASASHTFAEASASAGAESGAEVAPPVPPLVVQVGDQSTTYDFREQLADRRPRAPETATVAATQIAEESTAPRRWFRRDPEPMAAATPSPAPAAPDEAPPLPAQKPETATDASEAGPTLVYTATFLLSVYEVDKAQRALKDAAQKLGGFVSVQTDTQLTLRVPAERFEAALTAVETTGKVRARNVEALDVGDQYRDLGIRLRTAEAVRARLEAMLARADKIDDALRVEQELERVVREIEQLKGALRALGDRIAFSTLIIEFRPEARPDIDDSDVFRLPYPWLDELGLHRLLELAP